MGNHFMPYAPSKNGFWGGLGKDLERFGHITKVVIKDEGFAKAGVFALFRGEAGVGFDF